MSQPVLIVPKQNDWFYTDLAADFHGNREQWREVSESDWKYGLNVVPPIDRQGSTYMVGELYDYRNGEPVYAGFTMMNGRYFARLIERNRFRQAVLDLQQDLRITFETLTVADLLTLIAPCDPDSVYVYPYQPHVYQLRWLKGGFTDEQLTALRNNARVHFHGDVDKGDPPITHQVTISIKTNDKLKIAA